MLTLVALVLSVLVGSIVGYFVHRAIHHEWAGPLYRGHMEHHLEIYPKGRLTSDKYTIAKWYNSGPVLFTPAALLVITLGALVCWVLGGSLWLFGTFSVGLVAFGLVNDYVHDSFHLRRHWLHRFSFYKPLRRQHFEHHNDMTKNFGIVVMFWDSVFKTKRE
jgi:sterol desaturase/sphingolipid hydroxylase (fatty acid hydroxylase superfamily)